eukprot:294377-Chlamydomonas_euryale.AAC.2
MVWWECVEGGRVGAGGKDGTVLREACGCVVTLRLRRACEFASLLQSFLLPVANLFDAQQQVKLPPLNVVEEGCVSHTPSWQPRWVLSTVPPSTCFPTCAYTDTPRPSARSVLSGS